MQHPVIGHDEAKSAVTFREMRSLPALRAPAAARHARRIPAAAPRPAASIPAPIRPGKQKSPPLRVGFLVCLVEPAGIEPASESPLRTVLHA